MRLLLTGKNGQLGQTLQNRLAQDHEIIALGRSDLDLNQPEAIKGVLDEHQFDYIINTAAYIAVDQAESDNETAFRVNAESPGVLASIAADRGLGFIHFSTDFVFDGLLSRPYVEDDRTNPINVYGASKEAGEGNVLEAKKDAIIIRTSWVYSSVGKNFLLTMLRLGKERESLNVVKDQIGTPTSTHTLATAIELILGSEKGLDGGIYHLSDEGVASWYDFARAIMAIGGLNCHVKPIPATDYPTPAKRPQFSVMNKSKIAQALNWDIPHWQESLERVIKNEIQQ
jgi:dTDP-4-dehydrorhamnose reductase